MASEVRMWWSGHSYRPHTTASPKYRAKGGDQTAKARTESHGLLSWGQIKWTESETLGRNGGHSAQG